MTGCLLRSPPSKGSRSWTSLDRYVVSLLHYSISVPRTVKLYYMVRIRKPVVRSDDMIDRRNARRPSMASKRVLPSMSEIRARQTATRSSTPVREAGRAPLAGNARRGNSAADPRRRRTDVGIGTPLTVSRPKRKPKPKSKGRSGSY